MWKIAGAPMFVKQWKPFAEDTQPVLKSEKGFKFLAKGVGELNCVNRNKAQLYVDANLTKELPKEFDEETEIETSVEYSYPWLPLRRSICGKWGHKDEGCQKGNVQEKEKVYMKKNEKEGSVKKLKEKEKGVNGVLENGSPSQEVPVVEVDGNELIHAESVEVTTLSNEMVVAVDGEDEIWSSPIKQKS